MARATFALVMIGLMASQALASPVATILKQDAAAAKIAAENEIVINNFSTKFCKYCMTAVSLVEGLGEAEAKAILEGEIGTICGNIPIIGKECKREIEKVIDEMVQLVEQKLPPNEICHKVRLC